MRFLFLFPILFATLTQAADIAYPFYVENPTMGNAYFNIFNAIVALMKSSTYSEILKLIFLLGGFFVFIMGIFKIFQGRDGKEAILDFTKYMIAATMLLMIVIPNDSNLNSQLVVESEEAPVYYCNDTNNQTNNYAAFTVRMPQMLAWGFSTINSIGNGSTKLAATVFSNVSSNVQIQNAFKNSSRGGFGSEIEQVKGLLSINLSDLNQSVDYSSGNFGHIRGGSISGGYYATFLQQCVFMVKSSDSSLGSLISSTLAKTGNIRKTLIDLYPETGSGILNSYVNIHDNTPHLISNISGSVKPAKLLITIKDSNGNDVTGECGDFYTNVIDKYIAAVVNDNNLQCLPALRKVTPAGLYSLTKSDNASAPIMNEIAINSALISAYRNANSSSKIATDISFASGKSSAEFVLNSIGTGAYMAKMLPYMQMGIRAVLYAFFPFVFLIMLLPGGFAVIKSYLQSMLWVELWSPVAAILNMFLSYFTIDNTAAIYQSEGVSMLSQANIVSDANMLASVGGYLYASVPALTWLILKGSAQMLGSITGGMASGFSKNLNSDSIRRDLGKAKQAELTSTKTGGAVNGIAQMEFNQEMGNAEAESRKDAFYYNIAGAKNYLQSHDNVAKSQTRNDSINYGKGLHTTNKTNRELISPGEFEAMSENRQAEYMSGLSEEQLSALASSDATSNIAQTVGKFKEAKYIAEKRGVDLNSKEGVKTVSNIMSDMSSGKNIGDIAKMAVYTKAYAMNHHLKGVDSNGKAIDINEDSNLAEVASAMKGVNIDQAATEGQKMFMDENFVQTRLHELGMTSDAIHNETDMKKALKWNNKDAKNFDIKKVNGAMVAVNKETGNTFYAQEGQFLRHSDHKFTKDTMGNFGEKPGDLGTTVVGESAVKNGSYWSRELSKRQASMDKASVKAYETLGDKNFQDSFKNNEIATAGNNIALPDAAKKGMDKVLNSMTGNKTGKELEAVKNSGSYKTLSAIRNNLDSKNEITSGRALLAYNQFKTKVAGSNELWNAKSEDSKQQALANAGIDADTSGNLQSMAMKTQKLDLEQKDKYLKENDIKYTDKNGEVHSTKEDYENLIQEKMDKNGGDLKAAKMTASNEMFAKMRGFTDANNIVINSKTARNMLNGFGINKVVGAKIQQEASKVQYADIIKETVKSLGGKADDIDIGKMLGGTKLVQEASRLGLTTAQLGSFTKNVYSKMKNYKGGEKDIGKLMNLVEKDLKKIKNGTKIPETVKNKLTPTSNIVQPLTKFSDKK